jgi:hypothetical protein
MTLKPDLSDEPAAATPEAPVEARESGQEGSSAEHGLQILREVLVRVRSTGIRHDLDDSDQAPGRCTLANRLEVLVQGGWPQAELVEQLTSRLHGSGSVLRVMLHRAKGLSEMGPDETARVEQERADHERQLRLQEQADRYGENRARITPPWSDEELEEDFRRAYGGDPDLLERTRVAAARVRRQNPVFTAQL